MFKCLQILCAKYYELRFMFYIKICTSLKLARLLDTVSKFPSFSVSGLKDEKLMVDPTCPRCGEEPHTVEHWLTECPGTAASRIDAFGSVSLPCSVLTEEPKKA